MKFLKFSLLSLAVFAFTAEAHIGKEKITPLDMVFFVECIDTEMGANSEKIEAIAIYKNAIGLAGKLLYTPEEQAEFNKANVNLTEAMFGKYEAKTVEEYEVRLKKAIISCMNQTADNFKKQRKLAEEKTEAPTDK